MTISCVVCMQIIKASSSIDIVTCSMSFQRVGTIRDLGADWGSYDNAVAFFPDTRYGLVTSDGYNVYIRTRGAYQPSGIGYLSGQFETSRKQPYDWLNNVVGALRERLGVVRKIIDDVLR